MALDYVSLDVFKSEIDDDTTEFDQIYSRAITDASRVIDRLCGYHTAEAGVFAAQTMTRYFDVAWGENLPGASNYEADLIQSRRGGPSIILPLDMPLISLTSLKTDEDGDGQFEITWTSSDYYLYPLNGPPFHAIQANVEGGGYRFPAGQKRVEIAGVWGDQTAVPGPIRRATILLAHRYTKRPNSPLGLETAGEHAVHLRSDPDVKEILVAGGYIRRAVFA